MYVVEDDALQGAAPRRHAAHPDHTAAEVAAVELLGRYVLDGYRVVERLHDGDRWLRWVLRHDRRRSWAAVELRDDAAGEPSGDAVEPSGA